MLKVAGNSWRTMFNQTERTIPGKAWRGATAALAAAFCGLAADPQPAPAATPPSHPEVKPPSFKQSFAAWQREFWTDAAASGISQATLKAAFKGVEPDPRLPDLVRRRAPKKRPKGQAEFTRPPQAYVSEKTIARLAAEGRRLARTHAATLARIERRFGVPSNVVLAIWGRETAYGSYRVRHDAIRALATQAYMGRRHGMFRAELLAALRMLQDGVIARDKFKASWAGAVGLTQFMPSEYGKLAVDLDGDGHKNIWDVPDALASAANQLAKKGWVRGQTWGYEIETGGSEVKGGPEIEGGKVTCAEDGPLNRRALREWEARGVRRVAGRRFSDAHRRQSVFLFSPGGGLGPQFLATENFLVFKRYNMSDLYALFVGHLADRIAGGRKFVRGWGAIKQLPRRQIAAIQSILKKEAYPIGKIDGRIGPMTRSQIGQYQLRHEPAGGRTLRPGG